MTPSNAPILGKWIGREKENLPHAGGLVAELSDENLPHAGGLEAELSEVTFHILVD